MRPTCLLSSLVLAALATSPAIAKAPKPAPQKHVDQAFSAALAAMEAQAGQRHIQGVAVVAFAPGDHINRWTSAMEVVGHLSDHTNGDKGNNLLAIAYAKASEMANTLKDSGTSGAQPMTGEFGWQGGVLARVPSGFLIVAFSGGKSEDDVATSRAGLAVLQSRL